MKLRTTSLMLLLTSFSIHVFAQQKTIKKANTITRDSSQALIAYWKKGDTKTYSITHAKTSNEHGKPESTSFTYWATMKIVDSSKDGYHLEWKYILPPSGVDVPHANDIYEYFKGVVISFETSETGEFKGITNWQELRDHYVKMFELSLPKERDKGMDSVVKKVKQMFNSKQMVENSMAKEIMLLLQGYGNRFSTKESKVNTSLPNPFSAVKPIPALLSTRITELNPKLDYFKVRITQSIDKDAALGLFESIFDKLDVPKDSVITKANEILRDFEINDYCEIKATISSGWISSLQYTRTGKSQMISQKDSFLIEEKE